MPTGPVVKGSGWPLRIVLSCSVGGVRDANKRLKKSSQLQKQEQQCNRG